MPTQFGFGRKHKIMAQTTKKSKDLLLKHLGYWPTILGQKTKGRKGIIAQIWEKIF
jgi:hypothetical protein